MRAAAAGVAVLKCAAANAFRTRTPRFTLLAARGAARSFPARVPYGSRMASTFQPITGPEAPRTEEVSKGLPRWPAGWHDSLQYHFFFEDMFVHARVFATPSLEETSIWIFDHKEGLVRELLNTSERLKQADSDVLDVTGSRVHFYDGPGGGRLKLISAGAGGEPELEVEFRNKNVFSWLPAGQTNDAVIHRPDLELTMTHSGVTRTGRGYSKRYYGDYGPQWGYRFIQSSSLDGRHFLWTADATFRLGGGEAKYNYFKLLDGKTGLLRQAQSEDTYQQDCAGYAIIDGVKYVAKIEPLGEWMHDYKKGDTNSRMQLRYCRIELSNSSGESMKGYALNERCFGTL